MSDPDRLSFVKRVPYVVVTILLSLNAVPRMISSGRQHWFAMSVPQPERFVMDKQPAATWAFGYPFTCYFQVGREFATKDGSKLFWASPEQPSLLSRLSFVALVGNVALSVGIGIWLMIGTNRFFSKARRTGESAA